MNIDLSNLPDTSNIVNPEQSKQNNAILTGIPTAPTAPNGTNTDQIATTKFVLANGGGGGGGPITEIKIGINDNATLPSGNAYFYGDSITMGSYAEDDKDYVSVVSNYLGVTLNRFGINGGVLELREPQSPLGGASILSLLNTIPTKGEGDGFISFAYGINDLTYAGPNYNPVNFKIDYQTLINNVLSKGWLPNDIVVCTIGYIDPTTYQIIREDYLPTLQNHLDFNQAIYEIATENNLKFVDVYTSMKENGAEILLNDYVHPNTEGHRVMAFSIINALLKEIVFDNQKVAVQDISEFSDLKLSSRNFIGNKDNDYPMMLGLNTEGSIGILPYLPTHRVKGDIIAGGQYFTQKAKKPNGMGQYDFLLNNQTKLFGEWNSGSLYNYIEISGQGNVMSLVTAGQSIKCVLDNDEVMRITGNGIRISEGSDNPYVNTKGVSLGQNGAISAGYGGTWGAMQPFNSGYSDFKNMHSNASIDTNGGFRFYTDKTGDGITETLSARILPSGDLEILNSDTGVIFNAPTGERVKMTMTVVNDVPIPVYTILL